MRWFSLSILFVGMACTPLNEASPPVAAAPLATTPPAPAGPYVLVPAAASYAPLFADELATLRKRVFDLVAKQGVPLAPLEEVDALVAVSQSGRMRADGPVCAAPSALGDLILAKYGKVPQVQLRASCQDGACHVDLDIARPPEGDGAWEYLDRFVAPVEKPGTLEGWLAALDKLGPRPNDKGALLVGLRRADDHPVSIDAVAALGDWKEAPRRETFEPGQAALDKCYEAGWPTSGQDAIRLGLGADGAVLRCDVAAQDRRGSPARLACLCAAASGVRHASGAEGRRVEVRVTNAPRSGLDARGVHYAARFDSVTSSDHTEVRPQLGDGATAVSVCAAAMGLPAPVVVRVHLDVDPAGHVLGANTSATTDALRMCLIGNLRTFALPCARSGTPYSVEGVLNLWGAAAGR